MKAVISVGLTVAVLLLGSGSVLFAQSPPGAPPAGGTFQQRLNQRKRERNVQLDEREQRRLQQRCTRTQQKIRELQQKTGKLADNRTQTYERIDGKLWVIIGMLKLADVDTFELEGQRTELAKKVQGFHTIMGYYQQNLDDIAVINCQADVVGFKALVDTARIYHSDLRARSADIRSYVVDQIKQTLNGYVPDL